MDFNFRELFNGESASNYNIVGQAVGTASTTEFIISKSWTYGEIAQTSLLFVLTILVAFAIIKDVVKRKK